MLVTVFEFLKLASEDASVVRHTFLGYKVVRDWSDVAAVWGFSGEVDVKKTVAITRLKQDWLEDEGVSYAVYGHGRGIRLSRGISTKSLYEIDSDFDGNLHFRGSELEHDDKGLLVRTDGRDFLVRTTATIEKADYRLLFPYLFAAQKLYVVK